MRIMRMAGVLGILVMAAAMSAPPGGSDGPAGPSNNVPTFTDATDVGAPPIGTALALPALDSGAHLVLTAADSAQMLALAAHIVAVNPLVIVRTARGFQVTVLQNHQRWLPSPSERRATLYVLPDTVRSTRARASAATPWNPPGTNPYVDAPHAVVIGHSAFPLRL